MHFNVSKFFLLQNHSIKNCLVFYFSYLGGKVGMAEAFETIGNFKNAQDKLIPCVSPDVGAILEKFKTTVDRLVPKVLFNDKNAVVEGLTKDCVGILQDASSKSANNLELKNVFGAAKSELEQTAKKVKDSDVSLMLTILNNMMIHGTKLFNTFGENCAKKGGKN